MVTGVAGARFYSSSVQLLFGNTIKAPLYFIETSEIWLSFCDKVRWKQLEFCADSEVFMCCSICVKGPLNYIQVLLRVLLFVLLLYCGIQGETVEELVVSHLEGQGFDGRDETPTFRLKDDWFYIQGTTTIEKNLLSLFKFVAEVKINTILFWHGLLYFESHCEFLGGYHSRLSTVEWKYKKIQPTGIFKHLTKTELEVRT